MHGVDKIRTAMFARAPHGYLPNDVDVLLDELLEIAETASPADLLARIDARSFSDAEHGYSRDEVDGLLEELVADLRGEAGFAPAAAEPEAFVREEPYVQPEAADWDAGEPAYVAEPAVVAGEPAYVAEDVALAIEEPVFAVAEPAAQHLPEDYVAPVVRPDLPGMAAAIER